MVRNSRFWILAAVFQVVFGLAVFAITREYYIQDPNEVATVPLATNQSAPIWPNRITESEIARLSSSSTSQATMQDPVEISSRANEYFASQQYDRAAELYEQLLAFDPNSADVNNNLGLTLHYLGRSTEALRRLNDGLANNPQHQRTWLTLGYVNSQLGNTEQARAALTRAADIGTDESIRQAALRMLESLP